MKRFVVCITGASGTIYGRRLIGNLSSLGHEIHVVVSPAGFEVLKREENISYSTSMEAERFLADLPGISEKPSGGRLIFHPCDDIGSSVASGSFPVDGTAVVPCSMATVGALASGAGTNLIHRVADVAVKEKRPLVIAPRETPLSKIHLDNLARLAGLSVRVVPCMPAFYLHPKSVSDMVDFVVERVAVQMGVRLSLVKSWDPLEKS